MPRALWWVTAGLLGSLLGSSAVRADPLTCERGIARASARYVQARAKVIFKCEDAKAKGRIRDTIVCATDPLFDPARMVAETRLFATINIACGGLNRDCGDGDDEPLGGTSWGSVTQCPDFRGSGCTNSIATCVDVAECLRCTHDAAVGQSLDLYYAAFDPAEFGTFSAVNRCQRAIGKATTKYLTLRSKALQQCWDGDLAGSHMNPCPAGDDKAVHRISAAETKKQRAICKACGGPNALCDGTDDLALSSIGFTASCPDVTTFLSPASCSGAVSDLATLVDCVDCVTDYDVDCAGATSVPGIITSLPASCTGGASTTTSSSSPPSTSSTSTSSSSSSSSSSTSTSTSTIAASTSTSELATSSTSSTTVTTTSSSTTTTSGGGFDFLSTAVSGTCGNTYRNLGATIPLKNLLCGGLSLGGGLSQVPDNATPSGATNRFTLSCAGPACTIGPTTSGSTPAGVDCTDVGCLFGTPLPISNSGLSVCVTNTFSPVPPSGTLNLTSGAATWNFQLNSATVLTGNPTQPCPRCSVSVGGAACVGSPGSPCTGVCDGSPNQGAACTTLNPNGLTSQCPSPNATAGTQRCYRGTNNNGVCMTGGDCPGGLCAGFIGNIPISLNPLTTGTSSLSNLNSALCTAVDTPFACCTGVGTGNCTGIFCPTQDTTQRGAFRSDICLTGANSGDPCQGNAMGQDPPNCGAGITCRAGTLTNYCVGGANDGLGCSSAATCPAPGVCSRAGQQVQLISETGNPAGPLTISVASAVRLGSSFCVAATTNPTVNSNANLPAAGATSVVGTITLLP